MSAGISGSDAGGWGVNNAEAAELNASSASDMTLLMSMPPLLDPSSSWSIKSRTVLDPVRAPWSVLVKDGAIVVNAKVSGGSSSRSSVDVRHPPRSKEMVPVELEPFIVRGLEFRPSP